MREKFIFLSFLLTRRRLIFLESQVLMNALNIHAHMRYIGNMCISLICTTVIKLICIKYNWKFKITSSMVPLVCVNQF